MELSRSIAHLMAKNTSLFEIATVVSVDGSNACVLKLQSDLEVSVPLRAVDASDSQGFVITPEIGSPVKVLRTSGQIVITHFSKIQDVSFHFAGKYSIKNEQNNLAELISDLLAIVKTLKVSTPSGASGVPLPDVLQKVNDLETKFANLLQ